MSEFTIYHNPRCSTSRNTLNLLKDNNIEPTVITYLTTPPSAAELTALIKQLGLSSARDLMRKKEALYKAFNLDDPSLKEAELIDAMAKNPILIERPIVIKDKQQAIVARPSETVLDIL